MIFHFFLFGQVLGVPFEIRTIRQAVDFSKKCKSLLLTIRALTLDNQLVNVIEWDKISPTFIMRMIWAKYHESGAIWQPKCAMTKILHYFLLNLIWAWECSSIGF